MFNPKVLPRAAVILILAMHTHLISMEVVVIVIVTHSPDIPLERSFHQRVTLINPVMVGKLVI